MMVSCESKAGLVPDTLRLVCLRSEQALRVVEVGDKEEGEKW